MRFRHSKECLSACNFREIAGSMRKPTQQTLDTCITVRIVCYRALTGNTPA